MRQEKLFKRLTKQEMQDNNYPAETQEIIASVSRLTFTMLRFFSKPFGMLLASGIIAFLNPATSASLSRFSMLFTG